MYSSFYGKSLGSSILSIKQESTSEEYIYVSIHRKYTFPQITISFGAALCMERQDLALFPNFECHFYASSVKDIFLLLDLNLNE